MTLRTKSRDSQWLVWLCAALVFLSVYFLLSQWLYGTVGWNPLDYRGHRLMLPLVALFLLVASATRWDGVVRETEVKRENGTSEGVSARPEAEAVRNLAADADEGCAANAAGEAIRSVPRQPATAPQPQTALAGEKFFEQACAMPHSPIPDFEFDGVYLGLLEKSAAAGYAPASATLGEYAMCRATWVEAYYWMSMAKRHGMLGLLPMLREIRQQWARSGFPDESENANWLFTEESGSIGRALLHLDSGHDAAGAREFLHDNYPEFIEEVK